MMRSSFPVSWKATSLSFSNKAWHGWLEGVVGTADEDLGVAAGSNSVRAELSKMLLYEKGTMFKPHKEYLPSHEPINHRKGTSPDILLCSSIQSKKECNKVAGSSLD